jgi:hypothetical protein
MLDKYSSGSAPWMSILMKSTDRISCSFINQSRLSVSMVVTDFSSATSRLWYGTISFSFAGRERVNLTGCYVSTVN